MPRNNSSDIPTSPSPLDFARAYRRRTGLGAVASEHAAVTSSEKEAVSLWNPDADKTPENFATAGQLFKDTDGHWHRWTLQTTRFTTNNLKLPEGESSFPLTYRGYYSHGFSQNGAVSDVQNIAFTGGGWDYRFSLAVHGWESHGRTFTSGEIGSPAEQMPLEQMIRPVPLDDEEVNVLGLDK